jgi:hypothetical protein
VRVSSRRPRAGRSQGRLRASYRRLVALDFDVLLLAHGDPVVGGAREALRAFIEDPGGSRLG